MAFITCNFHTGWLVCSVDQEILPDSSDLALHITPDLAKCTSPKWPKYTNPSDDKISRFLDEIFLWMYLRIGLLHSKFRHSLIFLAFAPTVALWALRWNFTVSHLVVLWKKWINTIEPYILGGERQADVSRPLWLTCKAKHAEDVRQDLTHFRYSVGNKYEQQTRRPLAIFRNASIQHLLVADA